MKHPVYIGSYIAPELNLDGTLKGNNTSVSDDRIAAVQGEFAKKTTESLGQFQENLEI